MNLNQVKDYFEGKDVTIEYSHKGISKVTVGVHPLSPEMGIALMFLPAGLEGEYNNVITVIYPDDRRNAKREDVTNLINSLTITMIKE